MAITSLVPLLESDDLPGTIAFYTGILGYRLVGATPDANDPYWMSLERDGVYIMFSNRNHHSPAKKPTFTGVLYHYTDEVDALWEAWKDKVEIAWPIEDFYYGLREFGIKDNNGYWLSFGQEINPSV